MAGQQQPTTTTQIQKVELPPWVDQASQDNYAFAQQVSARPFQAYPGQMVAGDNFDIENASNLKNITQGLTQGALGQAGSALSNAQSMLGGLSPITPSTVTAGTVTPMMVSQFGYVPDVAATRFNASDLAGYLNPETQAVVDTTMGGMRDNLARSSQASNDAAMGSGAWGGSRNSVTQAVLQSQGAKDMASTEAGIRSSAYTDAANRLMSDNASALQAAMSNQNSHLTTDNINATQQRANQSADLSAQTTNVQGALQAALANQSTGLQAGLANNSNILQAAGLMNNIGSGFTNLGNTYSSTGTQQSALSLALGQATQQTDQAVLDAQQQQWQAAYNYPVDQLNMRLAALGMSPYGKTTTSVGQTSGGTSSSPIMQGLGGALAILPALFSDPATKKNIRKIGPTGAPGLNAYEYEYKDKMGGTPGQKHVGVMANEVKKVLPSALSRAKAADGKTYDTVDYGKVGQHIARKRGFLAKKAA